jgi:hypothetical protein
VAMAVVMGRCLVAWSLGRLLGRAGCRVVWVFGQVLELERVGLFSVVLRFGPVGVGGGRERNRVVLGAILRNGRR